MSGLSGVDKDRKLRSDVSGFDILEEETTTVKDSSFSKKSEGSMYSFQQKHVFSTKVFCFL